MSRYHENKARARTVNNEKTMTDQSAARETDLNLIVNQFLATGQAPGPARPPMFIDMAELPQDLRGFIEVGRSLHKHMNDLPPALQKLTAEELLSLTPEQAKAIIDAAEQAAKQATGAPNA